MMALIPSRRTGRRMQANPGDFRPAIIRLQESPPNPLGRTVLWATLVFMAALSLWANFARLDIVAVAEGKLVPATYLKIVQPTDAGVVKAILVKEGEPVKAGQVLMRMDPMLSASELKALTADAQNKRIALRRIDAELAGTPFARHPEEPDDLFRQVSAQHLANRQAHENALAQGRATLERAKHDLAAAEEVRHKLVKVLPHYQEQETAFERLSREGMVGRLMYVDKQRERIEKEQDLRAQEETSASARTVIEQEEKKVTLITAEYRRLLQTERVDVAVQLERTSQELARQAHRHQSLELRAPQDGVVKDLATHTIGTVASPGTILLTLVPKNDTLRAEVWVKNDDIGFVHANQPAKIKLAAFVFQRYGMLDGTVARVSADAAELAATGAGPGAGPAQSGAHPLAYRALVDLKSQFLEASGVKYRLAPGMQVTADIHLGTRTVLEYLLSPVTKAFQEAGRER
jgi:hemolysin D